MSVFMLPSTFSFPAKSERQKPVIFGSRFEVTIDESTKELCDIIKENSYLDIEKMVHNLPDISAPVRLINTVLPFDNSAFVNAMYSLRDKCYSQGRTALGKVFYLIGAYFKGFEKCDITLQEQEDGIYEFILDVTYSDGEVTSIHSGAYYDPGTGLFYGKDDKGMFEIGYNFEIGDMVIYATVNSWMRDFGFCLEYDILSYITPFYFYHTRRFKFFYGGKEWMIQAWKGIYVVANGAEIGVYNREPSVGTFYNCVSEEDMLKMSFDLYHDDELLLSREENLHWWINGFKLSKNLYPAGQQTLKFTVEMKDEEMLKAFCKSVDFNVYRDVSYTVDGLKVSLVW